MLAPPNSVDMKGKADVLIRTNESAMITDSKLPQSSTSFKTAQSMRTVAVSSLHAGDSIKLRS